MTHATRTRYPAISEVSLAVLIRTEPGEELTPEHITRALSAASNIPTGAASFDAIRADLDQAHLLAEDGTLTQLGDKYADMWRRFLAQKPRQ